MSSHLLAIYSDDRLLSFACASITYGFLRDIVCYSDRFRWMGRMRYRCKCNTQQSSIKHPEKKPKLDESLNSMSPLLNSISMLALAVCSCVLVVASYQISYTTRVRCHSYLLYTVSICLEKKPTHQPIMK